MGEWITHSAFMLQRKMHNDRMELNPGLTIREYFDQGICSLSLGGLFNEFVEYGPLDEKRRIGIFSLLEFHKIIGYSPAEIGGYMPIVSYDNVKQAFLDNLNSNKIAAFPCFEYSTRAYLPETEDHPFEIDIGCRPLVDRFCAEGFMTPLGDHYCWTPKIRPIMEEMYRWKTTEEIALLEVKRIEIARKTNKLNQNYEDVFNKSLNEESIMPLADFIKKYPLITSIGSGLALNRMGIQCSVPIIGLSMLFEISEHSLLPSFGSDSYILDFDAISHPYSYSSIQKIEVIHDMMLRLDRADFWDVISAFEPSPVNTKPASRKPVEKYKLTWFGDVA